MKGIECAFVGMLGRDAEVRTAQKSGRKWLSLSVIVGENPNEQWVDVASFSGSMIDDAPRLIKGTRIYVEGKLTLRSWTQPNGSMMQGLSVVAGLIQPMAQIGQRRPKKTRAAPRVKADPQAPLTFADGTSAAEGDTLPF